MTVRDRLIALLVCMRPHQWSKNLLIVIPLVAAHHLRDERSLLAASMAFIVFSLAASAIYALNDLRDREADRAHPQKRHRPIASGRISTSAALGLFFTCLLASLGLALLLPREFQAYLLAYAAVSVAYSYLLKRMLMIDVLTLAFLYTLRLLAGGAATDVVVSPWLLAFCTFLFLSLAFAKRYAELAMLASLGDEAAARFTPGRAYLLVDLDLIRTLGPTSGYMAVLVFALYLNSTEAQAVYPHVDVLWAMCPLLLYWITRLWFVAQRGFMHHDPIVFALTDRASYAVAAAVVIVVGVASYSF